MFPAMTRRKLCYWVCACCEPMSMKAAFSAAEQRSMELRLLVVCLRQH
jgi:hypothetical protein